MRSGMSDALASTGFAAPEQHAPPAVDESYDGGFGSSALMQHGVHVTLDMPQMEDFNQQPPQRATSLQGGGLLWTGSTAGATPGAVNAPTGLYFGPSLTSLLAANNAPGKSVAPSPFKSYADIRN
jgi:hypothetical protein